MALWVKAVETQLARHWRETPRAKYETAPRASQKIEALFRYLKFRWVHV
jgi:hypothetical protein